MKNLFILLCVLSFELSSTAQSFKLGNYTWSSINLDVTSFRNGDKIQEAKTDEEWANAGENKIPAYCFYNNDTTNKLAYGILYNWYAIIDPRGLAPTGWHIASDIEWSALIDQLGGSEIAGKKMKSTELWFNNLNGTNSSAFCGYPGGVRYWWGDPSFNDKDYTSSWWSLSENDVNTAFYYSLNYNRDDILKGNESKSDGRYVRCVKD